MPAKTPHLLLVLDGWGHAAASDWNAITRAPAAHFLEWWEKWPRTLLSASGKEVGLPLGLMGNSEVGHTNIGAGRVVFQTISRINASIADGSFQRNGALLGAIEHARQNGSRLHLFGLIGDGGVHASDVHYRALLQMACAQGLRADQVLVHALLDGRDTPPTSAGAYLRQLEEMLAEHGGRVASICGRFFAMDRDQRWERSEQFWRALVHGVGHRAQTAAQAYADARARGESDEFVEPTLIDHSGDPGGPGSAGQPGGAGPGTLRDRDAVICFNFRADRVRQISECLLGEDFDAIDRGPCPQVHYATMTQYRQDFACPVAFPPEQLHSLFGELVAARGLRQFRCAETEKYAHVTFFFNGGREEVYDGEERLLIPSPRVKTYDLQPQMSAPEVTDAVVGRLAQGENDLYVVNFANADMVGHTGDIAAAAAAVRAVDASLRRIVEAALAQGGTVAITADHGNSEMMIDPVSGETHTAHTTNPVPFLLLGEAFRGARLRESGILADVAPTLMEAMGIEQPTVMDGVSLLAR